MAARPTAFTLLVPEVSARKAADWTLETALATIKRVAARPGAPRGRCRSRAWWAGADAFASVKAALDVGSYHDVIISTLPRRTSEWLRRDLPRQVRQLGIPVTVITPANDDRNFLARQIQRTRVALRSRVATAGSQHVDRVLDTLDRDRVPGAHRVRVPAHPHLLDHPADLGQRLGRLGPRAAALPAAARTPRPPRAPGRSSAASRAWSARSFPMLHRQWAPETSAHGADGLLRHGREHDMIRPWPCG